MNTNLKRSKRSADIPVRGKGNEQCLAGDLGEDRNTSDWETKTLGEVAKIERGKFTHRPRNDPRFYGGNMPFVQTGDVTRSNGIVRTHTQTLNEDGVAISKVFPTGTILITIAANIGYAGILAFDSAAPDSLIGITVNGSVRPDFLNFYLRTQQPEMDRLAPKGTQKNINIQFLKPWPVVVPPLPEQKKIAHILSTVQRAIEAQERIIQTTTELKKALMHKLFTEGLRNEPQKQTEIGPVPESWEVVELGTFFQIKHGFAFDGRFFEPSGDFILMTPGHFHEEGGFRDQGEKTKYFTGDIPKDYVLAKDDLVVAMTEQKSGLLGSSAFVPEDGRYLHNQRLGLIVDLDTKRLSKRFLFNVFNLPHLRVEVAKTSTGSKVKHTSPKKLRAVKVGIPPTLEEQEEIATALSTTEQKIGVATNKKAQLQDLSRTLLHKLMTPKTRVQEFDTNEPN